MLSGYILNNDIVVINVLLHLKSTAYALGEGHSHWSGCKTCIKASSLHQSNGFPKWEICPVHSFVFMEYSENSVHMQSG